MESAVQINAVSLAKFEQTHRPRCQCWRIEGLRQHDGQLVCEVCGAVIVSSRRRAA